MSKQIIYYGNELYHYGTKGQKWGLRRYQNEDGSLTEEGRIHYGYGEARAKARAKYDLAKQNYKIAKKESRKAPLIGFTSKQRERIAEANKNYFTAQKNVYTAKKQYKEDLKNISKDAVQKNREKLEEANKKYYDKADKLYEKAWDLPVSSLTGKVKKEYREEYNKLINEAQELENKGDSLVEPYYIETGRNSIERLINHIRFN